MYQITESNNKLLAKAMSKFNIPSLLVVFIFFGSYFLYAQNHQTLIDELLDSYQNIGEILSKGSTEGISLKAEEIISYTLKLKSNVPEEKAEQYNILMNRIESHIQSLRGEKVVKLLRDKYDLLSHDILGYLNTFGTNKKYYVFACTGDLMHWVQQGKKQNDPYCTNPCGKIIRVIK